MKYNYKHLQEFGWFIAAATIPVVANTFISFDPDSIKDWHVWSVAVGGALVRAVGGGVLAWWGKRKLEGPE